MTTQATDFPYYRGQPVALSGPQWLLVMAGVVLGYVVLVAPVRWSAIPFGNFIPAIAFVAIPLAVLAMVAGRHWRALFHRVGLREIGWMFAFAALNLVVSLGVGGLVKSVNGASSNPAFARMAGQSAGENLEFLLRTLPQLLGEEVLTILPLLAMLWLFHTRFGLSRMTALVLAWLLSAAWFGMAHLPTYNWDWIQCLVIIGSARLVLSLAYLKTKNLWVSFGAHVINDWTMFLAFMLLGSLAAAGGT